MGTLGWLQLYLGVKVSNLVTSHSDHSPLLLDCAPTVRERRNYSFKFENSWLKEPDIEEVVVEGWNGSGVVEVSNRVLHFSSTLQH